MSPRAALMVALALVLAGSAGCLFPPAETVDLPADVEGGGTPERPVTPAAPTVVYDERNVTGDIEVGFTVGPQGGGDETHTFLLPPLLRLVDVRLDWDRSGGVDLDLAIDLHEAGGGGSLWQDQDTEGAFGDPDAETRLVRSDRDIRVAAETELDATVSTDLANEVTYTVIVRYAYEATAP